MGLLELIFIAIGLAADAFAAALCKGFSMHVICRSHLLTIAGYFGLFQAGMLFFGWALGSQFEEYIAAVDHWIAFLLLGFLGVRMILDSRKSDPKQIDQAAFSQKEILVLAVATSIDALAVGITFAFLQADILPACILIGLVTFLLSLAGVFVGNLFGSGYKKHVGLLGGGVLVLTGIKILAEHLHHHLHG